MSVGEISGDRTPGPKRLEPAYDTDFGTMFHGYVEQFLASELARTYSGQVQLIFTSPPFPLNRKKRYGNKVGEKYRSWLSGLAPALVQLLSPTGSVVIELGNAWEPGLPAMSTLGTRALLDFIDTANLYLCEQFVCHNPARLPSPVQWVNVERIRVKDTYTNIWWMSPIAKPKADNRRVLRPYSSSMAKLLDRRKYNAGRRPSGHIIGEDSFFVDNGGAIPSNVFEISNTMSNDPYRQYCREVDIPVHPARMPVELAKFFIRFLTDPGDLVFDPFAGSNTTGAAAEDLGRRWLSVEPQLDYIDGSRARFADTRSGVALGAL